MKEQYHLLVQRNISAAVKHLEAINRIDLIYNSLILIKYYVDIVGTVDGIEIWDSDQVCCRVKVDLEPHQQSAFSCFLLTMHRLTDEIWQKSTWTKMFTDDIVICSDSREEVKENVKRVRHSMEKDLKAALKNMLICVYLRS